MNEFKKLVIANYGLLSELKNTFEGIVTEERVKEKAIEVSIVQYARNKNMTIDEVFSMIKKAIDDQEKEVTEKQTQEQEKEETK